MIFGSINIMGIVGLAWCPLYKIQRIESLVVTNGSINLWFEIILRTIDTHCVIELRIMIDYVIFQL
jgi:hypothetical protein